MFFLSNINLKGQDGNCGTEDLDSAVIVNLPWYGKNDWLISYTDSIEAPFNCPNCRLGDGPTKTIYQIPVNVVVYYNNDIPDISDLDIQAIINEVNQIYKANDVLIKLYIKCTVKHISNNDAEITSNFQMNNVLGNDNEEDCLNIHFSNLDGVDACGVGKFPFALPKRYSCIVNYYDCGVNTLAHEIGHTLGLPHTFNKNICRNNCWQECVSRTRTQEGICLFSSGKKKCEVNGDCFCDTDADVNKDNPIGGNNGVEDFADCGALSYDVGVNNILSNCYKYDNYGDKWYGTNSTNSMENIMSYWPHSCRVKFSKMQRGAMYYYSKNYGYLSNNQNNIAFYQNIDVDTYENDNVQLDKDDLILLDVDFFTINSVQYHTFHLVPNSSNSYTACDVDWVYFNNEDGLRQFILQTKPVSGKPNPDTKITLYKITGIAPFYDQIAFHDNITTTNKFSKITKNLATGQYALKIENKITNIANNQSKGHYYISIYDCWDKTNVSIDGGGTVCVNSPQTFTITGIPGNIIPTYSWVASAELSIIGSSTGNSITVKASSNNTYTEEAYIDVTISSSNCSPFVLRKLVKVNDYGIVSTVIPTITGGYQLGDWRVCENQYNGFTATIPSAQTAYGWDWVVTCANIISQTNYPDHSYIVVDVKDINTNTCFPGNHLLQVSARARLNCGKVSALATKTFHYGDDALYCDFVQELRILPPTPNPSNQSFVFELEKIDSKLIDKLLDQEIENGYTVLIYDLMGNKVKELNTNALKTEISVSEIKNGIYKIVTLIRNNVYTSNFIVQH